MSELIVNGDMELDSDWSDYGLEGGDVQERSDVRKHGDTYSRHVNVDAQSEGFICSAQLTIVQGTTYNISAWYYIESGEIYIKREGNNLQFDSGTLSITGSWQEYTQILQAVGSGNERIRCLSFEGGAEFYIDDVSIVDVPTDINIQVIEVE